MNNTIPTDKKITKDDVNLNILLSRQLSSSLKSFILETLSSKIKFDNKDKIDEIKNNILVLIKQKNNILCDSTSLDLYLKYQSLDLKFGLNTNINYEKKKLEFVYYKTEKYRSCFYINYLYDEIDDLIIRPIMCKKYKEHYWFSKNYNSVSFNFRNNSPLIDNIDKLLAATCESYIEELDKKDSFIKPIHEKLRKFIFAAERIRDVYEIYPEIFDTIITYYQQTRGLKLPLKNKIIEPTLANNKIQNIKEYRALLNIDEFAGE